MKYNRVLLKLSGEALSGDKGTGFDEATCIQVAGQIKELVEDGCQVAIVIGGGNFWRGRTSETIMRNQADQIGMLATVMNCLYMSEICRYVGMKTQVYTPFVCGASTGSRRCDRGAGDGATAIGRTLRSCQDRPLRDEYRGVEHDHPYGLCGRGGGCRFRE